jgi:hypothetical protein
MTLKKRPEEPEGVKTSLRKINGSNHALPQFLPRFAKLET